MNKEFRKQKITSFTDLNVWKNAHAFVVALYKVTKQFPDTEVYGLTSQIRRAAVSVTSNIAEGFGRHSYKEKLQFYYLAQGSLTEIKNQLLIARDVGYLTTTEFEPLAQAANDIHALLAGFLKKTREIAEAKP